MTLDAMEARAKAAKEEFLAATMTAELANDVLSLIEEVRLARALYVAGEENENENENEHEREAYRAFLAKREAP